MGSLWGTTSAGADPRSWPPLPAHLASHLALLVLTVCFPALAQACGPKASTQQQTQEGKTKFSLTGLQWVLLWQAEESMAGTEELERANNETVEHTMFKGQSQQKSRPLDIVHSTTLM